MPVWLENAYLGLQIGGIGEWEFPPKMGTNINETSKGLHEFASF